MISSYAIEVCCPSNKNDMLITLLEILAEPFTLRLQIEYFFWSLQFNIQRLSFNVDHGVETLEEAKKALRDVIDKGSKPRFNTRS